MADGDSLTLQQYRARFHELQTLPIFLLLQNLRCWHQGLTPHERALRLDTFGPNTLKQNLKTRLRYLLNSQSFLMLIAALMAITIPTGRGKPPNWQSSILIIGLLLMNSTIMFFIESISSNDDDASLPPRTMVLIEDEFVEKDTSGLVPGDYILIEADTVIPAHVRLLGHNNIHIKGSNEVKNGGDVVFRGSTCSHGSTRAVVIATGLHTLKLAPRNQVSRFQNTYTLMSVLSIVLLCLGFIAAIVHYFLPNNRSRSYRDLFENILVILIGGTPIAMPTVLSVTMAFGSRKLTQQDVITKGMFAIEKLAGMDVLCCDKTGILTVNRFVIDKSNIEVFDDGIRKDDVMLFAAMSSFSENGDRTDAAIIGTFDDLDGVIAENIKSSLLKQVILAENRTEFTYIGLDDNQHTTSKGSPEQILTLCQCNEGMKKTVHALVDKFAAQGFESLAVAKQDSLGGIDGPWQFVGLLPLIDPPREDNDETIDKALNLGVSVKMITCDKLAVGKGISKRLGMGTNIYSYASLLDDASIAAMPVGKLVDKANGFYEVSPQNKLELVELFQQGKHICGLIGVHIDDAPALKKADVGIAIFDASDVEKAAADVVVTKRGLSVIINAVVTSREIFQRLENYAIYAISSALWNVVIYSIVSYVIHLDISPFPVLITVILSDVTIMINSMDGVESSLLARRLSRAKIFITGISIGCYLIMTSAAFLLIMHHTDFFSFMFSVRSLRKSKPEMMSVLYLEMSILSQALILVTDTGSWLLKKWSGWLKFGCFLIAQMVATLIAVYADWEFARIKGIGWRWAVVIWVFSIIVSLSLSFLKIGSENYHGQIWTFFKKEEKEETGS